MKSNKLKDIAEEQEVVEQKPNKKLNTRFGKVSRGILAGNFLEERGFRYFPFLLYLAFLASIYIANNYLAENKIRKASSMRNELKELRYEYITGKTELMEASKQSKISKKLERIGIKENTEPVKTIKIKKADNGR